jgi:hypothetical protein
MLVTRAMRAWPYWLKTLIQSIFIVLLLTPVESSEAVRWWIPAWLHGGYEYILGVTDEAYRAFRNLALAGGAMLVIWILDLLRARIWGRRKQEKQEQENANE